MNIKDLVPPLELCQKIPAGEFEDTCFFWFNFGDGYTVCKNGKSGFADLQNAYPAPTLSEIIEDLPRDDGYNDLHMNYVSSGKFSGWHIYYIGDRKRHCYDKTAATAALKLWLAVNKEGVKNG